LPFLGFGFRRFHAVMKDTNLSPTDERASRMRRDLKQQQQATVMENHHHLQQSLTYQVMHSSKTTCQNTHQTASESTTITLPTLQVVPFESSELNTVSTGSTTAMISVPSRSPFTSDDEVPLYHSTTTTPTIIKSSSTYFLGPKSDHPCINTNDVNNNRDNKSSLLRPLSAASASNASMRVVINSIQDYVTRSDQKFDFLNVRMHPVFLEFVNQPELERQFRWENNKTALKSRQSMLTVAAICMFSTLTAVAEN
jgi:hypothetical protein